MLRGRWGVVCRLYLVALVIRLLWAAPVFLHPERALDPDSHAYRKLALNLLHEHRFSQDFPEPGTPEVFRTPGYPLFLALVFGLFGPGLRWVVLVQVLLGAWVPVLTLLALRRPLGHRPALYGAWFLALWPEAAVYLPRILSDPLYQVGIALLFAALWQSSEGSRPRWIPGVFTLLALALYVRPAAWILVPVVPGWLLVRLWPLNRNTLRALVLGLILFLALVAPWFLRNLRVSHRPLWSTVVLVNLVFYDLAAYESHQQGAPFNGSWQEAYWQRLRRRAGWPENTFWQLVNDPDRLSQAWRLATESLGPADGLRFLGYRSLVALRLLFHPGYRAYAAVLHPPALATPAWAFLQAGSWRETLRAKLAAQPPAFLAVLLVVYLLELAGGLLGLVGAYRLWTAGQRRWVVLAAGVYLLLVLAAGINMNPRFRANYSVLWVPLWGAGLAALLHRRSPEL